jgi:hypothetical protein
VTLEALKNAQIFYSSSFNYLLGVLSIIIAILGGILVYGNYRQEKQLNTKIKQELDVSKQDIDTKLKASKEKIANLETELKKTINSEMKEYREKDQKRIDTALRFLSRVYRKLANDRLDVDDFYEYFYLTHIFFQCLINIEKLGHYDTTGLDRLYKPFYGKNITTPVKLKKKDHLYRFIMSLLMFGKRCRDNKGNKETECVGPVKSIYNKVISIEFNGFTIDSELKTELKNFMTKDDYNYNEEYIKDILNIADDWKDLE